MQDVFQEVTQPFGKRLFYGFVIFSSLIMLGFIHKVERYTRDLYLYENKRITKLDLRQCGDKNN